MQNNENIKAVIRKPAKYEEHKLQMGLVYFIRTFYNKKIAIWGNDGTSKSAKEGDKKRKLGYEKGMPDLILLSKVKPIPPLFIELKRPANKLVKQRAGKESEKQIAMRQQFIQIGYNWIVVDNLEKGINEIKQYFNL